MKSHIFSTAALILCLCSHSLHADDSSSRLEDANTVNANEIRVRNHDELLRAVRSARPGTKILVEPGTYHGGLTFENLHGTAKRPIVIAAADPTDRPIIKGGNSCLHLTDPVHVELRDLVLTGARTNGLNIDDGGSYDTPAHHIVLHGLTVHDIGSDRNHDAIKLSGLDDFRVEDCTVERWGKGGSGIDMVGCHRGVVTGTTFREGGTASANAVQMKGGSRDVTVRFCRFENAGARAINIGGSTGLAYFRPRPQGYEAKDIVVEDCTFIGSMAPVVFVGVDGAVVRYNTIYRPTRWVLRILQENQSSEFVPCRNGQFANNLIVFRSNELAQAVNIGAKTNPKSFRFSDNVWYCEDRPQNTRRSIRLPIQETGGTYGVDPRLRAPPQGDLRLANDTPVKMAGARSHDPR